MRREDRADRGSGAIDDGLDEIIEESSVIGFHELKAVGQILVDPGAEVIDPLRYEASRRKSANAREAELLTHVTQPVR